LRDQRHGLKDGLGIKNPSCGLPNPPYMETCTRGFGLYPWWAFCFTAGIIIKNKKFMKKIILSLCLIGMLFAYTPAIKAATQEETTQALIQLLTQMIQMIQQQIADIIAAQSAQTIALQQQQDIITGQGTAISELIQRACVPSWQCSAWSTCSDFRQTRTCLDSNECGESNGQRTENQSCTMSDIAKVKITNISNNYGKISIRNDVYLWRTIWNVSNNDIMLNGINFKMIGSAHNDSIQNFKLYVDGVEVASAQKTNANMEITFNPSTILSVGSRTMELRGDIVKGPVDRSFYFQVFPYQDIKITDTKYNYNNLSTLMPENNGFISSFQTEIE